MERRAIVASEGRSGDVLRRPCDNALQELERRVAGRPRIVTDAAPAGHSTNDLLDDDGNTSLDRNADNECPAWCRSEEHTSELQSQSNLVCRLLLEKKKETI